MAPAISNNLRSRVHRWSGQVHAAPGAHPNHSSIAPFDCVPNTRAIAMSGREDRTFETS